MKKLFRFWKIYMIVWVLGVLGVGVWQFDQNFVISSRSQIKTQSDRVNQVMADMDKLQKENESLGKSISELQSDKKVLEEKLLNKEKE